MHETVLPADRTLHLCTPRPTPHTLHLTARVLGRTFQFLSVDQNSGQFSLPLRTWGRCWRGKGGGAEECAQQAQHRYCGPAARISHCLIPHPPLAPPNPTHCSDTGITATVRDLRHQDAADSARPVVVMAFPNHQSNFFVKLLGLDRPGVVGPLRGPLPPKVLRPSPLHS